MASVDLFLLLLALWDWRLHHSPYWEYNRLQEQIAHLPNALHVTSQRLVMLAKQGAGMVQRKDDILYTCLNGTVTHMMIFFRRGFVLKLARVCCFITNCSVCRC